MSMQRRELVLFSSALPLASMLQAQAPAAPPKTHLKVGDDAPDFTVRTTMDSKPFQLSSFKGKNGVVVAFYPAAFTGG